MTSDGKSAVACRLLRTSASLGLESTAASLAREFKVAEQTYGADHLDLVLAIGYLSKLLRNGRVVGYLAKHFQELLFEFQKITEAEMTAA